jgi:hypothetical protein
MAAMVLASPVAAGPLHLAPHDPLIPHWDVARYARDSDSDGLPSYACLNSRSDDGADANGMSFGPIHAESETINGHRRVHYRVEGLTLFGGDIGGSVGKGGAMLTLHWASSGNCRFASFPPRAYGVNVPAHPAFSGF